MLSYSENNTKQYNDKYFKPPIEASSSCRVLEEV